MRKYLIILTIISCIVSYSQKITIGPDIGEIYFLGPTYTGSGLYYSTDFGETAICVDSIKDILTIAGDKTSGGVYCIEMPSNLYYSNNYGYTNSWIAKNSGINYSIRSGRVEGEIYSSFYQHSNDYGSNFLFHTCNGFFGDRIDNEIDCETNTGYILVYEPTLPDTIFLLLTNDNFENIQIQNAFYKGLLVKAGLVSGNNFGEIYINLIRNNYLENLLLYSNDFGQIFNNIDEFNLTNSYSLDLEGGRQDGEFYIQYNFINQMWLNAHTYIFHSIDYGNTFDVFHPFSKGDEPLLANFSTIEKEVLLTTPVEFSNFSIGEITEYQWDFEDDGIIDSYDEFPTHIYQDTGYYSVKLSVVGQDSTNTFIKENYIHVIGTLTSNPDLDYQKVNIFPNPFSDKISIETKPNFKMIEIYDLGGKRHYSKSLSQENKTEIIDLKKLKKGIYILKLKTGEQNITKKIIKI